MILKFSKILLILILLTLIPSVTATINTYVNPTCIGKSYDTGYSIFLSSDSPGANGNSSSSAIDTTGVFTPKNSRIEFTTNVECSASDPVVRGDISTQARVWGIFGNGVLFYTDDSLVDASLGNYSLGTFGISCSGAGGNCNPIHVVANLSASTNLRKLLLDQSGNLYVKESSSILKFPISSSYAQSNFFSFSGKTTGPVFTDLVGMHVDSSGNIYALTTSSGGGCATYCLNYFAINPSGTQIGATLNLNNTDNGSQGGLIVDTANPTTNFTYAYKDGTGVQLRHRNSVNTDTISTSPLAGVSEVQDIYYDNGIIYLSSRSQNTIFAYTTSFTGYVVPGSGATGSVELTYTSTVIDTVYSTYYNNSNFEIFYKVNLDKLDNLAIPDFEIYKYKVVLYDPNGIQLDGAVHFGPVLVCGFLSCAMNETLTYVPPSTGWKNGSWYAKLYEYNTETYNTALLDTSSTWTVLNQSFNGSITPPTPSIDSGTGSQALAAIDGWTAMFGLGVNQVSKFLFAMFIIVVFMVIGLVLTKMSFTGAVVFGVLPYCFFIYITYLPMWTVVILGIVIAMKIGIFR